ncbi:MAG: hypothetical protein WAL48_24780 [Xanthobacteraceae bacterium]
MADRPVEDVVADQVADVCAAKREVLIVTAERREISAHRHSAGFQADEIVQVVLVVPELRQAGGLAAPPHFLNKLKRVELRVGDQVAAGAFGERDLKNCVLHAEQALEIERRSGLRLIGVAGPAFDAALGVGPELVRVSELKINALFVEARAQAAPIAEHPRHRRDGPLIRTSNAREACRQGKPNCAHAIHGSAPRRCPVTSRDASCQTGCRKSVPRLQHTGTTLPSSKQQSGATTHNNVLAPRASAAYLNGTGRLSP